MRLFGGDRVQKFMETMNFDEDQPIEASFLSSAIESAQKKIEGRNFSIRKNVLDFDDVMSQQRMTIYSQRNKVLNGEDISKNIIDMMNTSIDEAVNMYCSDTVAENWNLDGLRSHFLNLYVMDSTTPPRSSTSLTRRISPTSSRKEECSSTRPARLTWAQKQCAR